MSDCCTPRGYRRMFSEKNARSDARRYRKKGLDATSRQIVDVLRAQGLAGREVLEVGGGVGAVQIELLKSGASRAVSVELTPTYEGEAAALLREAGYEERVERRVTDFARDAGSVPGADVVIMNRVLCCYPDMPRLAGAAAAHARELLVLSFPRETWWTRLGLAAGNAMLRLARREFRVFLHSPAAIIATSERHGLRPVFYETGRFWTVTALRRAT